MILLYILLAIVAIFVILLMVGPKKYKVNRSITINRPIDEVYGYLKFIKNQDDWSPWKKRDPNMKQTHTGTDGEVGFTVAWESDHKQVGAGEQELSLLILNELVESQLRFFKPWKSESIGHFTTRAMDENTTDVVWGFRGENKPLMSVFMLFINMDKAVGKDFEEGLEELKRVLENRQIPE